MATVLSFEHTQQTASPTDTVAKRDLSILIADDHPIVREGMLAVLNRQPNMRVVALACNGREAVDCFFEHQPDVALIDLRMPVMDGMEAVARIHEKSPDARLVMISSWECEEDIYRALRAGAQGYLVKGSPIEELIQCLRTIGDGGAWIPPGIGAKLTRRLKESHLTVREGEVLNVLAIGRTNKEIGNTLHISEATVKVHVTHLLEKLKVSSRTEAISAAIRRGLVQVDVSFVA